MLGTRDPSRESVQEWVKERGSAAATGTFEETARFADLVVLATLWAGTENAIRLAGADNLADKIVIDVTNPLSFESMPPTLALAGTDSGGEQVQRWLPASRVVKAFNTVGSQHMVDPDFPGGPPDMGMCGDDDSARHTVEELLVAFGWGVIDLGSMQAARYLEPLAMIWILHMLHTGNGDFAFRMLRTRGQD